MDYRFFTPKQRQQRLEASLREFESKHFIAVMNARNAAAAGQEQQEREAMEMADQLDRAYKRTLADWEILSEEIEKDAQDEAAEEVEAGSAS